MELTGMLAIAAVFTGSVLVALFIGEALITWTIRAMDAGVKRAEAARLSAQPQTSARLLSGRRPRLQRV
ncbi:MAG TPA: hypothetical protein VG498_06390 [Terriglobales bacterium]|nr:hypothetical protein [Terriglobales bacterium]